MLARVARAQPTPPRPDAPGRDKTPTGRALATNHPTGRAGWRQTTPPDAQGALGHTAYDAGMSQSPLDAPEAPTGPSTQTAVLEREDTRTDPRLAEPGDHERFAHYVRKEKILESALSGDPVIALCGKVWVPGRDPNRSPVCPECKEIYSSLGTGGDDKD